MHIFIAFRGTEEVARSGVTDTPGGVAVPEMAAECFEEGGVEVDRIEVHNVHTQTEVIDPTSRQTWSFREGRWGWSFPIGFEPPAPRAAEEIIAFAKKHPPKPPAKRGLPKKASTTESIASRYSTAAGVHAAGCATCGNAGFYEDADGLHGCPQRCIYATKKLTSCLRAIDVFLKRISE